MASFILKVSKIKLSKTSNKLAQVDGFKVGLVQHGVLRVTLAKVKLKVVQVQLINSQDYLQGMVVITSKRAALT